MRHAAVQKEEVVDGGPVVPLSPVSKLRSLNLPQPSSWQQQQQLYKGFTQAKH